jgi:hypothetical protein
MIIQRIAIASFILFFALTACGTSAPKESNESATATSISATPTVQPTEEIQGEPFISAPNLVRLKLLTSTQGAGEKPLFQWEPVPDASYYQLAVFDEAGKPYWAWDGTAAQIYLGGTEEQPPADSSGPVIDQGYSWAVVAYDTQDHIIASSEVRAISP